MSTDAAPTAAPAAAPYDGPIFDCDSHVHEHDFDFFADYLPKKYHEKWLLARKVGPDGQFGLYLGNRRVHNAEANAEGLVPPPGKLKLSCAQDCPVFSGL